MLVERSVSVGVVRVEADRAGMGKFHGEGVDDVRIEDGEQTMEQDSDSRDKVDVDMQ